MGPMGASRCIVQLVWSDGCNCTNHRTVSTVSQLLLLLLSFSSFFFVFFSFFRLFFSCLHHSGVYITLSAFERIITIKYCHHTAPHNKRDTPLKNHCVYECIHYLMQSKMTDSDG